jgi:hypothetical protein
MQRLIVSMMRFSTAVTLYGYEQLQSSVAFAQGEGELNGTLDRLQATIDSLSEVLVDNLGGGKKATLRSITSMAEDMVKGSFEGMRFVDPREMMKATADMIRQSADALAGRVSKVTLAEGEEPKPAADVLV